MTTTRRQAKLARLALGAREEPGLADAGLACDQQHVAVARLDCCQPSLGVGEKVIPPDQHGAHEGADAVCQCCALPCLGVQAV